MDQTYTYNFDSWHEKRKVLWRNIQLPGKGVGMIEAWNDHHQLYRLMQNADRYAIDIAKEETVCRRNRKQTDKWISLVQKFEETVQLLEDWTIMYRLTYS